MFQTSENKYITLSSQRNSFGTNDRKSSPGAIETDAFVLGHVAAPCGRFPLDGASAAFSFVGTRKTVTSARSCDTNAHRAPQKPLMSSTVDDPFSNANRAPSLSMKMCTLLLFKRSASCDTAQTGASVSQAVTCFLRGLSSAAHKGGRINCDHAMMFPSLLHKA